MKLLLESLLKFVHTMSIMEKPEYTILLFYRYTDIADPEQLRLDQLLLCSNLGMTGRTIVAHEGINATYEGTTEAIEEYISVMKKDSRFADVDFKTSPGTGDAFPRLSIKVRPEIVTTKLGDEDVNPNEVTGTHISPDELQALYDSGEEFYVIDMRNDYEQKVGTFKNAVPSGMRNFRDLKQTAKDLAYLKDKKVVTTCTGGIRCEKASGYLITQGFKDVSQINGGMHRYLEKYGHDNFKGKLYVFDGRVTVDFDNGTHEVIGRCDKCQNHSEDFADCMYPACNKHFICCDNCRTASGDAYCSAECEKVHACPEPAVV